MQHDVYTHRQPEASVPMWDELTGALIGLAKTCQNKEKTENTDRILLQGLAAMSPHAPGTPETLRERLQAVREEKHRLAPGCSVCANPCGNTSEYDMQGIHREPAEEIRLLKERILSGLREAAPCVLQELERGAAEEETILLFYRSLAVVSYDFSPEELRELAEEIDGIRKRDPAQEERKCRK